MIVLELGVKLCATFLSFSVQVYLTLLCFAGFQEHSIDFQQSAVSNLSVENRSSSMADGYAGMYIHNILRLSKQIICIGSPSMECEFILKDNFNKRIKQSFPCINVCQARV